MADEKSPKQVAWENGMKKYFEKQKEKDVQKEEGSAKKKVKSEKISYNISPRTFFSDSEKTDEKKPEIQNVSETNNETKDD